MLRKAKLIGLLLFTNFMLHAQTQQDYSSTKIYKKIEKLNFLGSVLYVGAHPDDENTSMISYLSNKTNARVGYLSLNRGDGGQNIIGTEMRELLGVIRTQELLEARKIDGGEQFFTRANDFGFSKNPQETFKFWDKDTILSDVVRTFRKFRPDVVINRFNHRTEGDTHGHHTASALFSVEAFDLAGRKDAFPEQLEDFDNWQPNRLYFNDSWFFYGSKEKFHEADHDDFLNLEMGVFLPITGKSNTEISALSRSQHKSQGFGSLGERGSEMSYIEPIKGDVARANEGIFAGIDTTWNRIKGGKEIGKILTGVQKQFDYTNPSKSLPELIKAYKLIQNLEDDYWRELKTAQLKEVIAATAGLYLEVFTDEKFGTPGESLKVTVEAINRSAADVKLTEIKFGHFTGEKKDITLATNSKYEKDFEIQIPKNAGYSSPYWLQEPHSQGMYTVKEESLIGLPEAPKQMNASFLLTVEGQELEFTRDIIYKKGDQIKGEIKEPFSIVPKISVRMQEKVLVFPDDTSREIKVDLEAYTGSVSGKIRLKYPEGWSVTPEEVEVDLENKGSKKTVNFTVKAPKNQSEVTVQAEFVTEKDEVFDRELYLIDYEHIPLQTVLMPAKTKMNRLEIKTAGRNIAYIHGAGDEIPQGLREIGYTVEELSEDKITPEKLKEFDAVVLGIRAHNINKEVVSNQEILFDYVKEGGTLITQYSQSRTLLTENLAPFKMNLSADRVTDEESAVSFLAPDHAVMNTPNKITQKDFEGWVQERGLYFPDEWGKEFTPIFGMHDQGEEELQGSLLIAEYGRGHYVYTGLSFFRQLPAGVPGAYRLLANILAL